ncbi:MAG: di-trans,poly-cis-decaprenylcistransferase, partial [Alphaproteobacteria bacterium]|nr:di-trans,poly-cis-decaprenylcistransferase [Alphaproteobacteria bacterium]
MSKDVLEHIAIIMDGNGRWALSRGLPRTAGHKKGAEKVIEISKAAKDLGIKYLTIYAFSTENWKRSKDEVDTLMGLLREYLSKDFQKLADEGIRICFIGEREMLPE